MLVFHVTFKCRPCMRETFLEKLTAEGIVAACRGEEGNMKYDYYFPVERADELLLIEKWRDEGTLDQNVQCVITDIEMPQMDGHMLTKLIKEDKK